MTSYRYEMDTKDHEELAAALGRCRAKVAVSGYRCNLMDSLYEDWNRFQETAKICHSAKNHRSRTEFLWTNYPPKQTELELVFGKK